ncbi:hypothetical protein SAMN05216249_10343 [Acetitomaculum ruminis DSM 5522]|uniref:Uncharacterized protein n=1 Tax=Acetitomaculum ruminis DSM 5522 TaxID=1120918 RepID=A0A1I0W3M7_9FIRM|nr:hypothetical protein [Acetitomaculum ruminis]SFA82948.1 hypothetical protein SAMN05216249_10343 [Acetitomaculum ruminis DSM 5522]
MKNDKKGTKIINLIMCILAIFGFSHKQMLIRNLRKNASKKKE